MSIDVNVVGDKLAAVLTGAAKGLWKGPEDVAFLKEVGLDLAKLKAQQLAGSDVSGEIAIVEETVNQKILGKRLDFNEKAEFLKIVRIIGESILSV